MGDWIVPAAVCACIAAVSAVVAWPQDKCPNTANLYRQSFSVDGNKCFVPLDGGDPFCFRNTNSQGE